MNTGKEILFFFSALGAFNGLVLGLFLLFFTKKKYLANYLLAALLLALSIRIGKSVFLFFDGQLPKIYLQIGLSACFFIGPFLYYFTRAAVDPIEKMPRKWKRTLLAFAFLALAVGIPFPYEHYPAVWGKVIAPVIYVQWGGYILAAGYVIRGTLRKLFTSLVRLKPAETWISMIFFGNLVIFFFYFSSIINAPFASYISGAITFSLILYLIASLFFYRERTEELFVLLPEKPVAKKLNQTDAEMWLARLEKVMKDKSLYRNPDLKLHELAKEIQISGHQLSALLNENLGKNFTTYINEFRIEEACQTMKSSPQFTVEAIGYDVGFNSKSTFFTAFKKSKGVTPASYQQSVNQSIAI